MQLVVVRLVMSAVRIVMIISVMRFKVRLVVSVIRLTPVPSLSKRGVYTSSKRGVYTSEPAVGTGDLFFKG